MERVDSLNEKDFLEGRDTLIMRNESQKSKNSVRIINDEAEKPLLTYNDLEEEEKVEDVTQLLSTTRVTKKSVK